MTDAVHFFIACPATDTAPTSFDGTIAGLIASYVSDPDSTYNTKLRHATKENYDSLMRRLSRDVGGCLVAHIRGKTLLKWHKHWRGGQDGKKIAIGHSLVGMLRTVATYGATLLESDECRALKVLLHDMRFPMPKPRVDRLTAPQVEAIRAKAHEMGFPSIALAQAFQFECTFRQKDCIGEIVPLTARELFTYPVGETEKWGGGITWAEIDRNMVLRHVTSKRQKLIEVDLKHAPMVRAELRIFLQSGYGRYLAGQPASSPIIIDEKTGLPYRSYDFRHRWRKIATAAGVPKHVKSMDTRAGAITEAIESGASLEDARKAATHSDLSMTAKYSRGDADAVAKTMKARAESRMRDKAA